MAWIDSIGTSNCSAISATPTPQAKLSTMAATGRRVPRRIGAPLCTPGLVSTRVQSGQSILSMACIQKAFLYRAPFPSPRNGPAKNGEANRSPPSVPCNRRLRPSFRRGLEPPKAPESASAIALFAPEQNLFPPLLVLRRLFIPISHRLDVRIHLVLRRRRAPPSEVVAGPLKSATTGRPWCAAKGNSDWVHSVIAKAVLCRTVTACLETQLCHRVRLFANDLREIRASNPPWLRDRSRVRSRLAGRNGINPASTQLLH